LLGDLLEQVLVLGVGTHPQLPLHLLQLSRVVDLLQEGVRDVVGHEVDVEEVVHICTNQKQNRFVSQ